MIRALERFSTGVLVPPWVRFQHEARYAWAATYCRGARVVDVACGAGHGAARCAEGGATSVVGFDASLSAVQFARDRQIGARGMHFAVADALRLPVPARSADLVVSLETLEHLEDPGAFLAEVARVLRPGGGFLCSTPNRAVTNPGTSLEDRPFNPHHVREYTRSQLEQVLHIHFARVELLGQSFYPVPYCRWLESVGRVRPALAVKLHQARKLAELPWERASRHQPGALVAGREPEYLLAICSL